MKIFQVESGSCRNLSRHNHKGTFCASYLNDKIQEDSFATPDENSSENYSNLIVYR